MSKRNTIIVACLLIISAVLISILKDGSHDRLDMELVDFYNGMLYGAGFGILIVSLFKKKPKQA
ncbi:hypothetical protein EO244_11890 [Ancylomarina salipaludis]|uniref:Uncharacterized protein n=1 Tax=Ancylomarina salipaludis TaxID=2501299 RepID=A0A4Q1JK20_9BACT|nr:hypothetical protein [Ancylomarina salipaludis]RXQ92244.1 hypothetical protein EO244_11890 [Ancylomarina salipaludis]